MTQGVRRAKIGAQTLRVSDVMERVAKLVPPATRATDALEQMESERLDHLIIFSGKTLLGVVSRRDLEGATLGAKTVAAFMTTRPAFVDPKTTLGDAAACCVGARPGFCPCSSAASSSASSRWPER